MTHLARYAGMHPALREGREDALSAPGAEGTSGIMRGMNLPEIKPAPSLPWYRALVSRTPRGRLLRRWLFLLGAPSALCLLLILGWDPRRTAARFGYRIKSECHQNIDCDMPCKDAVHALCMPSPWQGDPLRGICRCPDREEIEAHARLRPPPPSCLDPELLRGDGEQFEWRCRGGFASPDASTAGGGTAVPEPKGTPPP